MFIHVLTITFSYIYEQIANFYLCMILFVCSYNCFFLVYLSPCLLTFNNIRLQENQEINAIQICFKSWNSYELSKWNTNSMGASNFKLIRLSIDVCPVCFWPQFVPCPRLFPFAAVLWFVFVFGFICCRVLLVPIVLKQFVSLWVAGNVDCY